MHGFRSVDADFRLAVSTAFNVMMFCEAPSKFSLFILDIGC